MISNDYQQKYKETALNNAEVIWREMIIDPLNLFLKEFGIDDFEASPILDVDDRHKLDIYDKLIKKSIYPNEIKSAVAMLNSKKKLVFGRLGVRGGKTTSVIIALILFCCRSYLRGKKTTFFYFLPSMKSIEYWTIKKWEDWNKCLTLIDFRNNKGETISFYQIMLELHGSSFFKNRIKAMTNSQKLKDDVKEIVDDAIEQGLSYAFLWDEPHYQENKGGVAEELIWQSLKLKECNKLFGISATPAPYEACIEKYKDDHNGEEPPELEIVNLYHANSYVGFNFADGKPIDSNVDIITPNIQSFEELEEMYGLKKILYDNRLLKKGDPNYIKNLVKNLLITIQNLSEEYKKQYYQNEDVSIGTLIRVQNDNSICDKFYDELKRQTSHHIIKLYDDSVYQECVEEAIHYHENNEGFIILVSSRARMSEDYPCCIGNFIDYTPRYTNDVAMEQGLAGRAGNNEGKIRNVVVSSENRKLLKSYIDSRGKFSIDSKNRENKKHSRVNNGKRNKLWKPYEVLDALDPRTKPLIDAIMANKDLCDRLKYNLNSQKEKFPGGRAVDIFLTEDVLSELDKNYGIRFLRMGETPEGIVEEETKPTNYRYAISKDGKMKVSIRRYETGKSSDGGHGLYDNKKQTTTITNLSNKAGYVPQIYLNPDQTEFNRNSIVQVVLVRYNQNKNIKSVKYPTDKSMAHDIADIA